MFRLIDERGGMITTYRYVRHSAVEGYERAGWTKAADFRGTHHHQYSILMEAPRMILGLTGTIGSGKSTVADYLATHHGYKRHRMAGPLKAMIRALGLTDDHIEGDLKEVPCPMLGGQTPRYAMQTLGTEWGRDTIDPDLWVNAWAASMPQGNVVCEDVRFANEAAAIRNAGGFVIRIERGDPLRPVNAHASEAQEFKPDFTVANNGTIADLQGWIDQLIDDLHDPSIRETFGALKE